MNLLRILRDPCFLVAAVLTPILGLALQLALFHRVASTELIAGSILSLTHGALALSINALSVGLDTTRFLVRGLGFNGLRAAGLLGLLLWIEHIGIWDYPSFLVVVLVGYFTFLFAEVLSLHRRFTSASSEPAIKDQGRWQQKQ